MKIELIAVIFFFLLSAIPLLRLPGRPKFFGAVVLGVGAAFATVVASITSQSIVKRDLPDESAKRPTQVAADGFVSSHSCRSCHPQEYSTWHASYHRTMTQLASAESVVGDFNSVSLTLDDRDYRLFQRDGMYRVEIQEHVPEPHRTEHQIVMTTGSHHMQFYWYSTGDSVELGKLPFVFLFSEQRWVPVDSTFLRPPSSSGSDALGQWNQNCINCHTTHGKSGIHFATEDLTRSNMQAVETSVSEFGIACEACHGPGEEHVRLNRDPIRRYTLHANDNVDASIIQPETIAPHTSSQVCGQCHSVSLPKTIALTRKVLSDGFSFRAGHDLFASDSERVVVRHGATSETIEQAMARDPQYLENVFWQDGMIRVSGREFNGLIESPCYKHQDESKGIMQCMSCHEMHPDDESQENLKSWSDDQLKPEMRTDAACLQCHTDYEGNSALTAHTFHAVNSSGSRCYNCHMPHTTYGLLKGIRSHTVSVPSVTESVITKRPNACNLCHLHKTLKWTADQLKDRYDIESPELTRDQETFAASILWTMQGNAGVRVLMGWHMGWEPAVEVSGADWMPPYLAVLMADSYDAVRYVAYHSLLKNSKYDSFQYDFVSSQDRQMAVSRVSKIWANSKDRSLWITGPHLLIRDDGSLMKNDFSRLLQQRDNRPVLLNE
ncbi:MAG: hypothetical protein KDB27_24530 [Planctomycetales bacterium]|nr:hypothetical protein [Planctomycetales bacterium]